MKFSKPINREVDIDGNTFVVSFDDNGIGFRVKGKRRTAHVDWTKVLGIAQGEQGANGREFLGVGAGQPQQQDAGEAERMEQIFEPQTTETTRPQSTGAQAQTSRADQPTESEDATTRDELGRAVSAGEVGPES
ncbi:MAG TPA: hypothetical protein VF747_10295 [Blastocatellia bacterium]